MGNIKKKIQWAPLTHTSLTSRPKQLLLFHTPTQTTSQLAPVFGFIAEPQVNHLDQLTGFVQVPNASLSPEAIVLYQHEMDCRGTSTSISSVAPVANAVSAAKPVY